MSDQVQAFMDAYRPMMGAAARLLKQIQSLEDAWNGGVSALVAANPDPIPDTTTGLAGAAPLTATEVTATMQDFAQALTGFNSDANRQAYIKAAGLANTL